MKVAIDLHGTYDHDPEYFWFLIHNQMVKDDIKDIEFYILTGSPAEETIEEINKIKYKIPITMRNQDPHMEYCHKKPRIALYLSIIDFCREYNIPLIENGTTKSGHIRYNIDGPEELWWSLKSVICNLNEVDILIDNDLRYEKYFGHGHPTSFVWYNRNSINATHRAIYNAMKLGVIKVPDLS